MLIFLRLYTKPFQYKINSEVHSYKTFTKGQNSNVGSYLPWDLDKSLPFRALISLSLKWSPITHTLGVFYES